MTAYPLLLLPGLLCDVRLWRDQIAALKDVAACQVADTTQDAGLGEMALRALAMAPPRFALAGLSMGGYLALEIMRRAPERVTRLALMDTGARPDTEEQSRRRRGLMSLTRSGQFKGVTPRLLPSLLHPAHIDGPLGFEVREMAERVGREAFLRQQQAILHRPDSRPDLPRITVPTLVVVGEQDVLTPPELSEEMAAAIPNARLVRIPEAGHLPPMEQPERVTSLLRDWLAGAA
ncbi:alpha/beta fold hydrolase [Roseomonas marmotae]|uniref:Alpha/beta fold hydrolase n=1 Tax=Roseomonas marmotae TaxID=2768161 RepID=A0ABS3KDT6_9PROT|nr:alpha/beta fold hydrolase [Roseomonas marmotae]MBO1075623.1 alpha/beta fold hydrolase [Roseomonas marmotae]QTI79485.1 alpha/beta fold hydrolase [Roseomonas marmotae]